MAKKSAEKKEAEPAAAAAAEPEAAEPAMPEFSPKSFVVPAVLLGTRYFKIDVNAYVVELRFAFAAVVLSSLAVSALLYFKTQAAPEGGEITVKEKAMDGTETAKTMSTREYDAAEVVKKVKSTLMGLCISGGIHWKWGNATPLLMQCIMIPTNLLDDPMVKIHLFGYEATGKLQRPFKAPESPFAALMGGDTATETPPALEGGKKSKKDKKKD